MRERKRKMQRNRGRNETELEGKDEYSGISEQPEGMN